MEGPTYISEDSRYKNLIRDNYTHRQSSDTWNSQVIINIDAIATIPGYWIYENYTKSNLKSLRVFHTIGYVCELSTYILGFILREYRNDEHPKTPFAIDRFFITGMWAFLLLLSLITQICVYSNSYYMVNLLVERIRFYQFPVYMMIAVFLVARNFYKSTVFVCLILGSLTITGCLLVYLYYKVKYEDDGRFQIRRIEFLGVHLYYSVFTAWILVEMCESVLIGMDYWADAVDDKIFMGWEAAYWTITIMSCNFAVAVIMLTRFRDVFFAVTIGYTFFGVFLKQTHEARDQRVILTSLILGSLLLAFSAIIIAHYPKQVFYMRRN